MKVKVSEGTLVLRGSGNEVSELSGLDGTLQVDGNLTLSGGRSDLEGATGTINGRGKLVLADGATLTLGDSVELQSKALSLEINNGRLETGEKTVVLASLAGEVEGTLDLLGDMELWGDTEAKTYAGSITGRKTSAGKAPMITLENKTEEEFSGTISDVNFLAEEGSKLSFTEKSSLNNVQIDAKTGSSLRVNGEITNVTIAAAEGSNVELHAQGSVNGLTVAPQSTLKMESSAQPLQVAGDINFKGESTIELTLNADALTGDFGGFLESESGNLCVEKETQLKLSITGAQEDTRPTEDKLSVTLISAESVGEENKPAQASATARDAAPGPYVYRSGDEFRSEDLTLDRYIQRYYKDVQVKFTDNGMVLTGDLRSNTPLSEVAGDGNSHAGAELLEHAEGAAGGDADTLKDVIDDLVIGSDTDAGSVRKALSAVAGSSTAVLGMAQREALRGRLGALLNRASQLGLAEGYAYKEMPYWHAWMEAAGSYTKLQEDGDCAGFSLSNWGGTVGVDVDLSTNTSAGLALIAMRGKLTSDLSGTASGDTQNYALGAMVRRQSRRWAHTFVMTASKDSMELNRTVNYGGGSYRSDGETDGYSMGALYELTYDVPVGKENSTTLFQPLFTAAVMHNSLDAYSEEGAGGLGLRVGAQHYTTATFGLGVRMLHALDESIFNRGATLELRAGVTQDIGDARGESEVALLADPNFTRKVQSAELGKTAFQLGAGLQLPAGERMQVLFNASAELREAMTSWNFSAGIRYDF